jgi:hypothetical protein
MASAPQLPLFYNDLQPLSSELHADYRLKQMDRAPWLATQHAIPLTVEEFPLAQRFYPIVFSEGDDGVPLALMGLNEGTNVYVGKDGGLGDQQIYLPAYIRRYPFMLARLAPGTDELSLCFDSTCEAIGKFDEGEALFDGTEPSETTRNILSFNESFEQAGLKTRAFMDELREADLLRDGEMSIQPPGVEQPFVYRGFRMIDEQKLSELRGDQLRKMNQSGMLPLIYAHLFSLGMMTQIFAMQAQQGSLPGASAPAA